MSTSTSTNEELVREFHKRILTENDLEAADELLTEDYVEHNPILPEGVIHGRADIVRFWAGFLEAIPDLSITEQAIAVDGDTVVTRHVGRGTFEGPFLGLEPTGETFEIDGMDYYRVERGRLAEGWVVIDALGMFQQVGILPDMSALGQG